MKGFLFVAAALFLPFIAEAQFGPIVPEVCRTCACGFGGVLAIVQNVVNFIISISIIFATIIMVWAGGLYILSATNPESRSTANKMLLNAVIGLLVVLSAWLVVDFVMKTLYDNGSEFGPWNSILLGGTGNSCVVAKPTSPLFDGNVIAVPGTGTGAGGDVITSGTASHQTGAARLQAAGISISSSGNCADRRNETCTSLDGMRQNTISQAIAIKQACTNCTIIVTGGTEVGHEETATGHSAGYKIDLGKNAQLDAYIRSFTATTPRSNGDPRYLDTCGNDYTDEGDHWDITVTRGVCSPPK